MRIALYHSCRNSFSDSYRRLLSFLAAAIQFFPTIFAMSSRQRFLDRPLPPSLILGCRSLMSRTHLSSLMFAIFCAHRHFRLRYDWMIPSICVILRSHSFVFRSLKVTLAMIFSVLRCATASRLSSLFVIVQVSAPYSIIGNTQLLNRWRLFCSKDYLVVDKRSPSC